LFFQPADITLEFFHLSLSARHRPTARFCY
jgi:hypothetical protein